MAVDEVHCSENLETVFLDLQPLQTAARNLNFLFHLVKNALVEELKDGIHALAVDERCQQSDNIVVLQHLLTRENFTKMYLTCSCAVVGEHSH